MPQLPEELLKKKLKGEIDRCRYSLDDGLAITSSTDENVIPREVTVSINDIRAPVGLNKNNNGFVYGTAHSFKLTFGRSFPYKPPDVEWLTPIYHPNISMPSEGGKVCLKMLDNWLLEFNLPGLINSIVLLLVNPNPLNPLDAISCTEAAEIMNKS